MRYHIRCRWRNGEATDVICNSIHEIYEYVSDMDFKDWERLDSSVIITPLREPEDWSRENATQ